jgi:hypothetical protein
MDPILDEGVDKNKPIYERDPNLDTKNEDSSPDSLFLSPILSISPASYQQESVNSNYQRPDCGSKMSHVTYSIVLVISHVVAGSYVLALPLGLPLVCHWSAIGRQGIGKVM